MDAAPKNKFEYWFEVILFSVLMLLMLGLGIYGSMACTAFHPCPVWSQVLVWIASSMFNVFANLLLVFTVVPVLVKRMRQK